MSLLSGDPRHGTESAYKNYDCRCDACRAANTSASRERKRNRPRRPLLVHDERHGTTAGYVAGCRCDPCRAAQAAYKRECRLRKATAA